MDKFLLNKFVIGVVGVLLLRSLWSSNNESPDTLIVRYYARYVLNCRTHSSYCSEIKDIV